jgi:hypothetical protein
MTRDNSDEALALFRMMKVAIQGLDRANPELLHQYRSTYRQLKSHLQDMIDFLEEEKEL